MAKIGELEKTVEWIDFRNKKIPEDVAKGQKDIECIRIPGPLVKVVITTVGDMIEKHFWQKVILDNNHSNTGHLWMILNDAQIAEDARNWIPKNKPTYSLMDNSP